MNLAFNLRPKDLSDFIGQEHLTGKGKIIERIIAAKMPFSLILWGPPGSGKTTLATIISRKLKADFHMLEATSSGKEKFMEIIKKAQENKATDLKTILFIDEIHRWNKAQQDALLPHVENGLITLIGATTQNPSFEVISALLSRLRVLVLKSLSDQNLNKILLRAIKDKDNGLGKQKVKIQKETSDLLIAMSQGDARIMLNGLELAFQAYGENMITPEIIREVFQTKSKGLYDKKADEHYNLISAFIKSMRGSDTSAALYYMIRILENGEDPKFIARRMIIFASEDIGMADRGALIQANEAFEAVEKIGLPEAELILTHIVIYLCKAAKSRKVANSLENARKAFYDFPNEPVPMHLRNAPTKFMKNLGYAKNYTWSKDYVGPENHLSFLPEKLSGRKIFEE